MIKKKYQMKKSNNKKGRIFMAFSKGQQSTEATFKKYYGVASVNIISVNPTRVELEKIYNTTLDKEPEYISEKDGVKSARVDFIVKTDSKVGVDLICKHTFFISDAKLKSSADKIKVIDKYGRTAWVTDEELKDHKIPQYKNGPAKLDVDYRPLYRGEEALTEFIRNFLNIPSIEKYDKKTNSYYTTKDAKELKDGESRLEHIENMFKGDFKEVKDAWGFQPNNLVKIMFGIRTNDNKQYQSTYTRMSLKNGAKSYDKLYKDIQDAKANGAEASTEYFEGELKEYIVTPTSFDAEQASKETSECPFDYE